MKSFIFSALAATLCVVPAMAQPETTGVQMFPAPKNFPAPGNIDAPPGVLEDGALPPRKSKRPTDLAAQIKQDLQDFAHEFNPREFPEDPETPIDSIAAQEDELARLKYNGPYRVFGAREGFFGYTEWLRSIDPVFAHTKLVVNAVEAPITKGDILTAKVKYAFKIPNYVEAEPKTREGWERERQEVVQFKSAPSLFFADEILWQIVPPEAPPSPLTTNFENPQNSDFWNTVAYHLSQKQLPSQPGSVAERSIHNLKELGLGAIQFSEDYKGRFAFVRHYLIEALTQYTINPNVFQVPETNEIYTFNEKLSDANTNKIRFSTQTVLFYEGQNEKPIFRHDGKAAICFADGHVALVTPDEAQKLIWKP